MFARAACPDEYFGRDITFNIILKFPRNQHTILYQSNTFLFLAQIRLAFSSPLNQDTAIIIH